jgi:hypothetical protein
VVDGDVSGAGGEAARAEQLADRDVAGARLQVGLLPDALGADVA